MRVTIDTTLCTGHGRCYSLAPGLFAPDDDGYGTVIGDELDPADRSAADLAVANCPERAITIED